MPDSVPMVRKTVSGHYKILLIKPSEEIESSVVFVTAEWVCNLQCKWRTLCVLSLTTASASGDLKLFYFCFGRVLM